MDLDLGNNLGDAIEKIDNEEVRSKLISKLNTGILPAGSFGRLETIALQIGLIQQTLNPVIINPALLVFVGDHGITGENVSASSVTHTSELVIEFLNHDAAINRFAHQNELPIRVIDVGVDHSFSGNLSYWLHQGSKFFNRKINNGTRNFAEYPAMTTAEMEKSIKVGMDMVTLEYKQGCNTIGLGEIGVGNTTSAACLCAAAFDTDPEEFILKSRLDQDTYDQKLRVIKKALHRHPKSHDPQTLLTVFGGYEIAALVGAMLRAAEHRMLILIDGYVSAAALVIAQQICSDVRDYCIFCSGSHDPGHQNLLNRLNAEPLLNLDLKMGVGTGVSIAFPLVRNAVSILHQLD